MVILLVVIDRPRKAPVGIFILVLSLLSSQLVSLVYGTQLPFLTQLFGGLELVSALIFAVVILCMSLRDPDLPSADISPAFEKPHRRMRSPEDNLTLWQWMSVSWMSPLIAIGYTRQLHDEDVWSLSYEFQHRILHQRFRELGGSVVRRLLSANGIDLAILSFLGVVEALSSTSYIRS